MSDQYKFRFQAGAEPLYIPAMFTWVEAINMRFRAVAETDLKIGPLEVDCDKHNWQEVIGTGECEECHFERIAAQATFFAILEGTR